MRRAVRAAFVLDLRSGKCRSGASMRVRKRCLPRGGTREAAVQVVREIEKMARARPLHAVPGCAGIVPHAGWHFSGGVALEVLSSLTRGMDTIVIIGGHMGSTDRILCAFEDSYETPLGAARRTSGSCEARRECPRYRRGPRADNTVEVHLPFVRFLSPDAMVLGMRRRPFARDERWAAPWLRRSGLGRKVGSRRLHGPHPLRHELRFCSRGRGREGAAVGAGDQRSAIHREHDGNRFRRCPGARRPGEIGMLGGRRARRDEFAKSERDTAGAPRALHDQLRRASGESFVGYAGILYAQGAGPQPEGPGRSFPASSVGLLRRPADRDPFLHAPRGPPRAGSCPTCPWSRRGNRRQAQAAARLRARRSTGDPSILVRYGRGRADPHPATRPAGHRGVSAAGDSSPLPGTARISAAADPISPRNLSR